jgi:hypothetical protein
VTDRDSGSDRDARPPPSVALTAGAALFNEGAAGAARDAWDAGRRSPDDARDDDTRDDDSHDDDARDDAERLRRALAATAAATERAADGDASGAADRAETALASLASVSDPRGVALTPVREWAERLASGSEGTGSGGGGTAAAPRVRIDGSAPTFDGLSLAAAGVAASALARAGEPGDPETLAAAAEFADEERGTGRTEFAELVFAYLRTPDARPQVAARLGDRVERERRKRRDVDDLF